MITDKCDVWSCGVIMYLLLCGYLPFGGKSDKMIMNSIQNDDLLFPEKEWGKISQEAKDLLSRVLSKDPELRMTSKQAFHHSWIQNYNQNSDLELQLSNDSLTKLAQFKSNITIKHAALEYISSHYCAQKDLKKLQKAFKAMDRNGDGKLSREELAQIYNNANLTRRIDIQQMINEIDADFNGFVDYSEFITATIDWEKELSKKKLEATFRTFDLVRVT